MFSVYNKHSVPKEAIIKRIKDFKVLIPYFFGWFLNSSDSGELVSKAKKSFSECLEKVQVFNDDLKSIKSKFSLII